MSSYLIHYGTKGQKWGERRYQNEDGSLTPEGRIHYGVGEKMKAATNDSSITKRVKRDYNNLTDSEFRSKYKVSKDKYRKRVNKYGDPYMNSPLAKAGKALNKLNGKNPDKVAKAETKGSLIVKKHMSKKTKAIIAGAAIATGVAIVGALIGKKAYNYNKINKANQKVADEAKLKAKLKSELINRRESELQKWQDEMKDKYSKMAIDQIISAKKMPFDPKTGERNPLAGYEDEYADYIANVFWPKKKK